MAGLRTRLEVRKRISHDARPVIQTSSWPAGACEAPLQVSRGGYGAPPLRFRGVQQAAAIETVRPRSDEAELVGTRDGGGAGVDLELAEEIRQVGLDGPGTDEERVGDFAVGATGHQQAQYLQLATGQSGDEPGIGGVRARGRRA